MNPAPPVIRYFSVGFSHIEHQCPGGCYRRQPWAATASEEVVLGQTSTWGRVNRSRALGVSDKRLQKVTILVRRTGAIDLPTCAPCAGDEVPGPRPPQASATMRRCSPATSFPTVPLQACWPPSPCGRLSRPRSTTEPPPRPGAISRRWALPPFPAGCEGG